MSNVLQTFAARVGVDEDEIKNWTRDVLDGVLNDTTYSFTPIEKARVVGFWNLAQATPSAPNWTETMEAVKKMLKLRKKELKEDTVMKMILHHSQQLAVAVEMNQIDVLVDLYDDIYNLPSTTTRFTLKEAQGISLDGVLFGLTKLIRAIDIEKGVPLVLKLADPIEVRAVTALDLREEHEGFIKAKVVELSKSQALLMPMYLGSLGEYPAVSTRIIFREGKRLYSALQYMHKRNWVHLDVKSSNVFLDNNGGWYLGDFDASREIGAAIGQTTLSFYPVPLAGKRADPNIDFFHLGLMLVIEWCCKKDFARVMGVNDKVDIKKIREVLDQQENEPELKGFIIGLLDKYVEFYHEALE